MSNGSTSDHFISFKTGIEMTSHYRTDKENILLPEYRNQNLLVTCETFDRSAFDTLLAQGGCVGIRVYFGMESNMQIRTLFVGVNANDEDMLPVNPDARESEDNHIVELGQTCPDHCPPPSPLNED